MLKISPEDEKRACLWVAEHWLGGEVATVTRENLARLLFEQRQAVRGSGVAVEPNDCCFEEVKVDDA